MSFQGLRASRDKKQVKSFVTDQTLPSATHDNPPDILAPPSPGKPEFRYGLPASMEMKVVPSKGRAIFSTVSSKPGFAPVRHCIEISGANSRSKAAYCFIADLACWYYRPRTYRDIALTAVRNL